VVGDDGDDGDRARAAVAGQDVSFPDLVDVDVVRFGVAAGSAASSTPRPP
jgi:hypothetical protein